MTRATRSLVTSTRRARGRACSAPRSGRRDFCEMTEFTLEAIGGLWAKRLDKRRAGLEEIDWSDIAREATPGLVEGAREVWTRSAFSEYASGASFAEIAKHLLAAKAPIDLIAAAGDFVGDEMFHAELASRVAMSLGGAVPLDVS